MSTNIEKNSSIEGRSCVNCTHCLRVARGLECRNAPPQFAAGEWLWPVVPDDGRCGRWKATVSFLGSHRAEKISDARLIQILTEGDGVMPRSDLVEKLVSLGLATTTAYTRIRRAARDSKVILEEVHGAGWVRLPNPDEPLSSPPRSSRGRRRAHAWDSLHAVISECAPDVESRKGFNVLYRSARGVKTMGKGTFKRIVDEALRDGHLSKHADGDYFCPPAGMTLE